MNCARRNLIVVKNLFKQQVNWNMFQWQKAKLNRDTSNEVPNFEQGLLVIPIAAAHHKLNIGIAQIVWPDLKPS